jgi:hypothetical protein
MPSHRLRNVHSAIPTLPNPFEKIDVFEPQGVKALVKASQRFPGFTTDHKKRAGGLFDLGRGIMIHVKASELPVDGIARPQAIQPEDLTTQGQRRGKAPNRKARLRPALLVNKLASGGRNAAVGASFQQGFDARQQHCVRIQQKNKRAANSGNPLIYSRCKTPIAGIREQPCSRASQDFLASFVGGAIVNHNHLGDPVDSSVKARADFRLRVVSDDDRAVIHVKAKYNLQ